jgi:hypothetical protein
MCTRPNPSYCSVRASARALGAAVLAALHSVLFLLLALASAPFRYLWRFRRPPRPAALAHVDVQVHLGNPACITELEAIVWKTLARAERTWAPLALPVDRVVVGAGFPASGRADIYDDYPVIAGDATPGDASSQPQRRVVISLGVRDGTRDLDGWEIAGALAAQIQAIVDERCRQHRSLAAPAPDPQPVAAATRLMRLAPAAEQQPLAMAAAPTREAHATAVPTNPPPGQEVPRLAELIATVQQGQPLVAAGPTSNGTHP